MQIILKDVILFGFHGVHPLEKKVGTSFRLNIIIELNPHGKVDSIADTVDYSSVYEKVKHLFNMPADLLETVVENMAAAIYQLSSSITEIDITLEKLNAPIDCFKGTVGVRVHKKYA